MKPLHQQNYYEILGIPREATPEQIRKAFEMSKQTFESNSLATYSLFSDEENREILTLTQKAYNTLFNLNLRQAYDQQLQSEEQTSTTKRKTKTPASPDKPSIQSVSSQEDDLPPMGKNALQPYIAGTKPFDGSALKAARLLAGISLDELASQTKIRKTYLSYLEAESFSSLPASVYVRGFVKLVAAALSLPIEQTAQDYMNRYASATQPGQAPHGI
ncbi:MAG: helix-turn-helix domain-containing protein [Deltaproteobacteria bacterium]|nr:helix-turn-helix domain-containing protein [Deltaproteobacteria bacterium]